MKYLLLFVLFITCVLFSYSQETCGTMLMHQKELDDNPAFDRIMRLNEKAIQSRIHDFSQRNDVVHQIPVVVHVVHLGEAEGVGSNISDSQIQSGIQQLNDAFRDVDGNGVDVKIEFVLAKQDPNCNATDGIIRVDGSNVTGYSTSGVHYTTEGADQNEIKDLSRWPNNDFYNIWVVTEIDGNNGGGGIQGYAYFPGASSAVDGTVIMNTAFGDHGTVNSWNNQGKTLIHELGHALNLYHTFEGDNDGNDCPSDGCGSDLGDCCDDTEIHIRSSGCPSGTNSCTGVTYAGVQNNFMDYSNQDCRFKFTSDQKNRMRAALEELRPGLIISRALNEPSGDYTTPTSASCTPTTSETGLSGGYSGIMNFTFDNRSFQSSTASNDGGYVDYTDECLKLIEVTEGESYDFSTVVWVNTHYLKIWIDYDNNGEFNNSNELIHDATVAAYDTSNGSVSIPTDAIESTTLRMRAMVDLSSSFSSACHNPTYGQAEDFAIFIKPTGATPVADFSASSTSICIGESIQFTDLSSNSPTSWDWQISGASTLSSSEQNPSFTFDIAGEYNVSLIAINSNGQNEMEQSNYITVYAFPEVYYNDSSSDSVLITAGAQTIPEGVPSGGTFSGSGVSGNQFDPEVAGLGSHTITYSYTDPTTNCSNSATYTYIVYDQTVGQGNLEALNKSIIISNNLILIPSNPNTLDITVFDASGRTTYHSNMNTNTLEIQIDNLPSGVYMLVWRIINGEQVIKKIAVN